VEHGGVWKLKANAQIKIAVFLSVSLLVLILYLQGQSIIKPSLNAVSWIATIVVIALAIWDKWVWRWKFLYPFSKMPDVRGTWKAELNSYWEDPTTNQTRGKIEVYLVFRQTFSRVSIRLFSSESSSVSLSANVCTDDEGVHTIATTYLNTPSLEHLSHSPISHGGMLLNVRGGKIVKQIDGKYWTDRLSRGELKMSEHSPNLADGFDDARKLNFKNLS
jgi:hypothetical protein